MIDTNPLHREGQQKFLMVNGTVIEAESTGVIHTMDGTPCAVTLADGTLLPWVNIIYIMPLNEGEKNGE